MNINKFPLVIKTITILSLALCIISFLLSNKLVYQPFYAFSITLFTVFYHFAVRLLVGGVTNKILNNKVDYNKIWFKQRKFEQKLYKKLKVKKWKAKVPTYEPELFSIDEHSLDEIAGAMCQSEIVHEINVLISFVPIIFSIFVGDFWVFFITSILSAMLDLVFVIIQRYNRPRVIRLMKMK